MTEHDIFTAAIKLTGDPRSAFLAAACGQDAKLREQVEALLRAHEESGGMLPKKADRQLEDQRLEATQLAVNQAATGTMIGGRYKLIEAIGEGGMGAVWLAEQKEPVKRKVAVKLVKAGMDSKQVLSRFEAERQALAMMDHPNIAKVFDGGMTEQGRPFFVMEFVKGVPLTEYCDQARLSLKERLNLFVPVCQAVQHAHQKGIIHRDLKPSNILICLYDGKPVPKVIDFGLAKAMHQSLTDHSLHTAIGMMVGTPLYMSPEQAEHNNLDVDTRTDIYSLGVMLYELLTGSTPLEKLQLKAAAFNEILRLIKEVEPQKPSTRLSSSLSLPSIAAQRSIDPNQLKKSLIGDLDWIVMKALDKERSRRYETANGLARDIDRFLNDEAVEACPPSSAYRLRKFIRRNRGQVIAASLVLLALVAGIVGTGWQAIRAENARMAETKQREVAEDNERKAEAAKVEAQAKEAEANAVVAFFENKVFAAARPQGQDGGLGKEVSLRDAIAASLPALGPGFTAQPLVEARLRRTLGITFQYLAEYEQARDQFEQSRALYMRHRGPDHPHTLWSMNNLAVSYAALNRPAEALKLREEVLENRKRVLPKDHPDTLNSMSNLANSYATLNRPAEALKLHEEVLEIQQRVLPKDDPATLTSMTYLAKSYAVLNRPAEALKLNEEVLEIKKRVLPKDHPDTLASMMGLALSYADLNRPTEALKLNEEVLEISKRVLPKDHPGTLGSMHNLANSYSALNRPAEALKLREEVLEIQKRVLPTDHPDTLKSMMNLAASYSALNRPAEALKLCEEVLEIQKRVLPKDHPHTLKSMMNLASSYANLNRPAEALKLREEVLEIQKRVLPEDHSDTLISMWALADSLITLDRDAEAMPLLDEYLVKAAGQAIPPRLIPNVMALRMRHFQKVGDPAGCRATAEMWENLNRPDAGSLYNAACWRSVSAAVQVKTPGADPGVTGLAQEDANQAMEWLLQAVAAGFKDAAHMNKDTDLDPLREREDFKQLLQSLTEKQTPANETGNQP